MNRLMMIMFNEFQWGHPQRRRQNTAGVG